MQQACTDERGYIIMNRSRNYFFYLFIISRALQGHSTDVQYNLTQNIFTVTT